MVAGTNGQATRVYRARNSEASPFRYTIHPQDQFKITMEIEDRGEEIAAIYHSHTKSPPEPSQTDINLAENWPEPLYLICSLAQEDAPGGGHPELPAPQPRLRRPRLPRRGPAGHPRPGGGPRGRARGFGPDAGRRAVGPAARSGCGHQASDPARRDRRGHGRRLRPR